jgi:hypothetical protein
MSAFPPNSPLYHHRLAAASGLDYHARGVSEREAPLLVNEAAKLMHER